MPAISRRFGAGQKGLQRARQQHDQPVHEGGDSDIDGNQNGQFAQRRRGASDEFRNHGDEEQRGLWIEQVGDKSSAELHEERLADGCCLDRLPTFLPAVVSQPAEIQRASPAKAFINEAVAQDQRSRTKPDHNAEQRQSQRDAEDGGESGEAAPARAEHGEVGHVRSRRHFDHERR